MKVKVLPDRVVNKIAAGEIIDRPSSVVRELVDNSIDAGARTIRVELEAGGERLIRVVDDGIGMDRDDAILAFERHATSKIDDETDLEKIATMGFRGEALPSIASVSKVSLKTRPADKEIGTEVSFAGGMLKSVASVPMPVGTDIEVRHLFFNTPARRKFLKQPETEEKRVKQWILHAAIAHPEVTYRLFSDGKEVLAFHRAKSSHERAQMIFRGTSVAVSFEREAVGVEGLVAHPSLALADTSSFVLFVNGRLISDRSVLRAVKDGFDSTLKDREFPVGFISIKISPEEVDVNVHPQKSEVRFRKPQNVYAAVRDAVSSAVKEFKTPVPFRSNDFPPLYASGAAPEPFGARMEAQRFEYASAEPVRSGSDSGGASSLTRPGVSEPISQPSGAPFRFSNLKYVGQVLSCYLLCEYEGALYVVDMHAAHERCNYNIVRRAYDEKGVSTQELLVPVTVELSPSGAENCEAHAPFFEKFGLIVERFGESSILVRGVPTMVPMKHIPFLIKEVAAIPFDEYPDARFKEVVDHVAARIACHGSIRSGDLLEREEAYALFSLLDNTEFSSACPHGRPIIVRFSSSDIESWFGRDR